MSTYVIGDVQGCFEPLLRLLEQIQYDDSHDQLWFVGDLVNRGPQSLEVLRLLYGLSKAPVITLGNHDLHLLGYLFTQNGWKGKDDTIQSIRAAEDGLELGHWLRRQKILHTDHRHNITMTHAGILPVWDLADAQRLSAELEQCLSSENFQDFLQHMYGNGPTKWSESLQEYARMRFITNAFTRMRFCSPQSELLLDCKFAPNDAPEGYVPWFSVNRKKAFETRIIFGHWAALEGRCPVEGIEAIDTGCLWGGCLSAYCLETRRRSAVPSTPS